MRFHVLAVPHTITNKEFVACAFTQKVFKFCDMMTRRGHTVIHYGHEESDVTCTEHVTVIDKETYMRVYGDYDWKVQNFKFDLLDEAYQTYNTNAIREIRNRQQPNDVVLAFWGQGNKAVCDQLSDMRIVEPGIGYSQAFAPFRVYESYALMHANLGLEHVQYSGNMPWHHSVIPNYFDSKDFEFSETKKDYFLYLGRITRAKGVDLIISVTEHIGAKLVIAGQGGPGDVGLDAWPSHVEYVGYAFADKRRELMKNAKGVFIFSTYVEPFAGTMIESFFSGTPVISTDWGTFAENNLHGITGYRCRTFDHMVWAARNIHRIDPRACLTWAQNFSLEKVAPMYEEYFRSISRDWYSVNETRPVLDCYSRTYPVPQKKQTIDAFFQCYNQVVAAEKALETYRNCYPDGKVVMINDGGEKTMDGIAVKYNAEYTYLPNIGICYWKNPTEWIERFLDGIQQLESDYFVMQEEDVWHVRPVDHSKLVFDICGTNPDARFPDEIVEYISNETGRICTHYSGSGGCFFRTSFFKKLAHTDWRRHLEHVPHRWLWADVVISFLACLYGGTIGYCTECVELDRPEYKMNKNPAVIHQYKVHYVKHVKVLWISAFRDIKRDSWSVSQRSTDDYFTCFERLLKPIGKDFVCFVDEPHAQRVQNLGVRTLPFNVDDTFIPKYYDRQKQIIDEKDFHRFLPENLRMCPEYTNPDYALTLYSKQCLIRRASDLFPEYTHYAWIDFGYAKTPLCAPPSITTLNIPNDKICVSPFRQFGFEDNQPVIGEWGEETFKGGKNYDWTDPYTWMKDPMYFIKGNLFFVPKKLTHWFENAMDQVIEYQHRLDIVIGHDEPLWLQIAHKFYDRFEFRVKTEWRDSSWFVDLYREHVNQLRKIIEQTGELCEGNVLWHDKQFVENTAWEIKRKNLSNFAATAQSILEIGFNAGHSCLLYLMANSTSKIDLFDIGEHTYTRPCFEYLDSQFPGRMTIVYGDSRKTLKNAKRKIYNLIHIDGGHEEDVVRSDFENTRVLSDDHTVVISDDDDMPQVHRINREYLERLGEENQYQFIGKFSDLTRQNIFRIIDRIPYVDENDNIVNHRELERNEQNIARKYIPSHSTVLELGARYGTVSCVINSILSDPTKHVAVDPDISIIKALEKNRTSHGAQFHIFNGVVSRKPLFLQLESYCTHTTSQDTGVSVSPVSIEQLEEMYSLKFDCLVADCEGFMEQFIRENEEFVQRLETVTYEEDQASRCDYAYVTERLQSFGFSCIHTEMNGSLHFKVWKKMNQGYFLLANGEKYVRMMMEYTIPSIRKVDPYRPISVFTNTPELVSGVDQIILYDPESEYKKLNIPLDMNNSYDVWGTIPRFLMLTRSPYEETLSLDCDLVCIKSLSEFWNTCHASHQGMIAMGESDEQNRGPSSWHWGRLHEVCEKTGVNIPQIGGQCVYYRKCHDFIHKILPYYRTFQTYGIQPWFRDKSPSEEIFFALYMGLNTWRPMSTKYIEHFTHYKKPLNDTLFVHVESKDEDVMKKLILPQ